MTVSINGITLPLTPSVRDSGIYVYVPYAEIHQNGMGETITAGLPSVTWTYPQMEQSAYSWWVTTLLAGAFYLRCSAVLLDDLDVETSFSSVVVRYPTYSRRSNGLYYDVTIKIDSMVKA